MAGNNVVQITGVLSPTIRDNYHNCYNTPVHVIPRASFEAVNKFNGTIRLFNYDRNARESSTKISRKAVPNDQFSGGTTVSSKVLCEPRLCANIHGPFVI